MPRFREFYDLISIYKYITEYMDDFGLGSTLIPRKMNFYFASQDHPY